jgi:hypothetical protein
MGLATNISDRLATRGGIFGIGYDYNEFADTLYPNFMDVMVSQNLINAKLYSLWLNDINSSKGQILFGGIDTEKYYGTLYSMPVHPDRYGNYTSFTVGLTSISISPEVGSKTVEMPITNASFSTPIDLSASAVSIWLPGYVADIIYSAFGAWINSDSSAYVDCKYANDSFMSFGFESGAVVKVPYNELISSEPSYIPNPLPSGIPFTDVCFLAVYNGDE